MYYSKRRTITYTIAIISYTDIRGKRITEEEIKLNNVTAYSKFELYKILTEKFANKYSKPFVHKVVRTYYWEE